MRAILVFIAVIAAGGCAFVDGLSGIEVERAYRSRYNIDILWTAQLPVEQGLKVREMWLGVVPSDLQYHWFPAGEASEPLFAGEDLLVGTSSGVFRAYESETGKRRWSVDPGIGPLAGQAGVAGETVVTGSLAGWVAGLDRRSGETRWKFQVNAPINGRIVVHENRAFVPVVDGSLYAVDIEQGDVLWTLPGEALLDGRPTVRGAAGVTLTGFDQIVYGRWDARVVAVQASTGKVLWSRELAKRGIAGRGIDLYDTDFHMGNYMGSSYFTTASRLIGRIRDDDGIVLWQKDFKATSGAAVDPAAGIVTAGNQNGELKAWGLDGTERWLAEPFRFRPCGKWDYFKMFFIWSLDCNQRPDGIFGQPVVIEGLIAVPRSNGDIRFYDPETGQLVSTREARGALWGHLGSDPERGLLAVVDNKGTLYVIRVSRVGR